MHSKMPYIILYFPSIIISWIIYLNDNEITQKRNETKRWGNKEIKSKSWWFNKETKISGKKFLALLKDHQKNF